MKSIVKGSVICYIACPPVFVCRPRSAIVDGPVHPGGIIPKVFHNINFPAGCPSPVGIVCGKKPYGGPESFTNGHLCPELKTSIGPVTLFSGPDPARGKLAGFHILSPGCNGQNPVGNLYIVFLVVLQFIIAPARNTIFSTISNHV